MCIEAPNFIAVASVKWSMLHVEPARGCSSGISETSCEDFQPDIEPRKGFDGLLLDWLPWCVWGRVWDSAALQSTGEQLCVLARFCLLDHFFKQLLGNALVTLVVLG